MRKEVAALGSTVFLFVAPGTVVVLLPWWLTGWRSGDWWPALRAAGLVPLIAGAVVLLSAYVRFVVEGLGTPAPVAPPSIWSWAGCTATCAIRCTSP